MVAMIDMGLRNYPDKQALPFFLSLSTLLINPTSEGLPTRSDSDSLNAWEDAGEAQLRSGVRFVYVGRVTWNGHRELPVLPGQPATLRWRTQKPIWRALYMFVCFHLWTRWEADEDWCLAESPV